MSKRITFTTNSNERILITADGKEYWNREGFPELAGTPPEKEKGSASANTDPEQQLGGVITEDYSLYDEDLEALFNLRCWVEKCLTEGGAEITGTGIGFGGVDLMFDLDGFPFYIECKPRSRRK